MFKLLGVLQRLSYYCFYTWLSSAALDHCISGMQPRCLLLSWLPILQHLNFFGFYTWWALRLPLSSWLLGFLRFRAHWRCLAFFFLFAASQALWPGQLPPSTYVFTVSVHQELMTGTESGWPYARVVVPNTNSANGPPWLRNEKRTSFATCLSLSNTLVPWPGVTKPLFPNHLASSSPSAAIKFATMVATSFVMTAAAGCTSLYFRARSTQKVVTQASALAFCPLVRTQIWK